MSFSRLLKFSLILLLIILSTVPVFAAADQINLSSDTTSRGTVNCTSATALVDITSEYSQGSRKDFKSITTVRAPREIPADSFTDFSEKFFHEQWTLPFYNSKETKWCLAPLSDKFTFDPMTDIKNLEVLLQYKF